MANENMQYQIGQIVQSQGHKAVVGRDGFLHVLKGRWKNTPKQPVDKSIKIDGIDTMGTAHYIYYILRTSFPMEEMLCAYDEPEKDFINEIAFALNEIGIS